jgi:hypothetical protein
MTAWTTFRFKLILLSLAASVAMTSPTMAQAPRAGIVTAAQGEVSAARSGLATRIPLKFKDDVFLQDRIEAGDGSFAKILLGGKALVTVRERSVLTITEVPGRATVELGRGQAVLSLGKSLLAPGESVEIRTPSAIAAVRGSTVLAIVEDTETIAAFAVSKPVLVSLLSNPGTFVELASYQMLNVLGTGGAASFSAIRSVPPGLLRFFEQPKTGHVQQLPDKVVEQFQRTASNAANQGDPFPPSLGSSTGFGAFEGVCQNSPSSCAPPVQPPGSPPVLPPGPAPPQPQIQPATAGLPPAGPPPAGPPPGPPPPGPPAPSLGTPSFKPPGSGAPLPFQPFPGGGGVNLPPGHGGVPPGQLKK